MGPHAFDLLDLEIIERVYEAAWTQLQARRPFRNTQTDDERKQTLRKQVMNYAAQGNVEFDALYEKVVANMPDPWPIFTKA
jgi:hypothetical protein